MTSVVLSISSERFPRRRGSCHGLALGTERHMAGEELRGELLELAAPGPSHSPGDTNRTLRLAVGLAEHFDLSA